LELLAAVMMIDTIGEPHTLEIDGHRQKVLALPVTGVMNIDPLQQLAYGQVVFSELIGGDIAPGQCSFCEKIDVFLLL